MKYKKIEKKWKSIYFALTEDELTLVPFVVLTIAVYEVP